MTRSDVIALTEALRDTRHAGDAATVRVIVADRLARLCAGKPGFHYSDFMREDCAVEPLREVPPC